jgi:hypothetical protein
MDFSKLMMPEIRALFLPSAFRPRSPNKENKEIVVHTFAVLMKKSLGVVSGVIFIPDGNVMIGA